MLLLNKTIAQQNSGAPCCCGVLNQKFYNNFDFESAPMAPYGGWIDYSAGDNYDGWSVISGSVSIHNGFHGNMGFGNPNGQTQHMDLHGGTPGGVSYQLTGLTSGFVYTIEIWYAIHIGAPSATVNLQIADGAWLNVSWSATNKGDVIWLKASYMFTAQASSTSLKLIGSGPLSWGGMLIDDIKIFECPNDTELPTILDEPQNLQFNCIADVPNPLPLNVQDNCDLNPIIKYSEKVNKISECEQNIERKWEVSDHCGNSKIVTQQINVLDKEAPIIIQSGKDKLENCSSYSKTNFNLWLNKHAGATATDNCKEVLWEYSYDQLPRSGCDTTIVAFIAKDHCGNETTIYQNYIVLDSVKPILLKKPDNVVLNCSSFARDSLYSWLIHHGNAIAKDSCSGIFWTNNFSGDSSALEIKVEFIAIDSCGNQISTFGFFQQVDAPDTNYVSSFNCNSKITRIDTNLYLLPGCDSVVINTKIGIKLDTTFISKSTCDPLQLKREIIGLSSFQACDSIVVVDYNLLLQDTTFITTSVCGLKDTTIQFQTLAGLICDSIVMTTLIPRKTHSLTLNKMSCDSNLIGTKVFNLTDQFGCDSIVSIITELTQSTTFEQDSLVCGLLKNYSDTIRYKLSNCDSLHIIHFLAQNVDSIYISYFTCDSLSAGTTRTIFNNQYQCDSIVIQNTIYKKTNPTLLYTSTCDKFQKPIDTTILQSSKLCDSIIITNYTIHSTDTTFIYKNTCNANQTSPIIQIYSGTFCDSTVITDYTFISQIINKVNYRTCFKDSAQTDTIKFLSADLCDSLLIREVSYLPIELTFNFKDISCFDYQDGNLNISSWLNAKVPIETILDGINYGTSIHWSNLSKGTHTIFLLDKDNCKSDSFIFEIKEPNKLSVNIGSDLVLDKPEKISFSEKSGKIFSSYEWIPNNLFDCPDCALGQANISNDTSIYLLVKDENGCLASDTLNIRINKKSGEIYFPNVFSPNGDNINDFFYPNGSDQVEIQWLKIYDRWGNLVFKKDRPQINNPSDGWDGKFKGLLLDPAVYSYVCSVSYPDKKKNILFGDITLLR
ncbi:MAG: gliding motility-associated C-terminal domain-containing protein [Saprospiraceae bacterium]